MSRCLFWLNNSVVKKISPNNKYLKGKLLSSKQISIIPYRYFNDDFSINKRLEESFKRRDGIPQNYNLIYRAPIKNYVKFAYATAFIGIPIAPGALLFDILYNNALLTMDFPIMFQGMPAINDMYEFLGYCSGLMLIALNVWLTVFRYPYRIYNNPDTGQYIFMFQSIIPWKDVQVEMMQGELKHTKKTIMPWKEFLYSFRNRKALIFENHFRRPIDLDIMMQKPKKDWIKH